MDNLRAEDGGGYQCFSLVENGLQLAQARCQRLCTTWVRDVTRRCDDSFTFQTERREKASDWFRDGNFVFAEKVSFDEAFATIDDFEIHVKVGGLGRRNHEWTYTRKNGAPGEYIDCANSLCYRGRFSIGGVLREMVGKKLTEHSGSALCQGYEGSPKGRRKYRDCLTLFTYNIRLSYKLGDLPS